MLRRGSFLAILGILQIASAVWAAPVLECTVLSLDRRNGRITAEETDTRTAVNILIHPKRIPKSVVAGSQIVVWGAFTQSGPVLFRAWKMAGTRKADPTGVRSRLQRGGKKGK